MTTRHASSFLKESLKVAHGFIWGIGCWSWDMQGSIWLAVMCCEFNKTCWLSTCEQDISSVQRGRFIRHLHDIQTELSQCSLHGLRLKWSPNKIKKQSLWMLINTVLCFSGRIYVISVMRKVYWCENNLHTGDITAELCPGRFDTEGREPRNVWHCLLVKLLCCK